MIMGADEEHRHRALALADHVANAIPATGKRGRQIVRAEHGLDLLERRLPFDHRLRRDRRSLSPVTFESSRDSGTDPEARAPARGSR
jgi:hypothetical protein